MKDTKIGQLYDIDGNIMEVVSISNGLITLNDVNMVDHWLQMKIQIFENKYIDNLYVKE